MKSLKNFIPKNKSLIHNKYFQILITFYTILSIVNFTNSKKARCYLIPEKSSGISGELNFNQENKTFPVKIQGKIYGAKKGNYTFNINKEKEENLKEIYNQSEKVKRFVTENSYNNIYTTNMFSNGIEINFNITTMDFNLFENENIFAANCELYEKNMTNKLKENNFKGLDNRIALGNIQNHEPLLSLIFGFSVLGVGFFISFIHFVYFNRMKMIKEKQLKENEVEVRNI